VLCGVNKGLQKLRHINTYYSFFAVKALGILKKRQPSLGTIFALKYSKKLIFSREVAYD